MTIWRKTIDVADMFTDEVEAEISFAERAQTISKRVEAVIGDEMAETGDAHLTAWLCSSADEDEFNDWWDRIYDWCDAHLVWIDTIGRRR